MVFPMVKSPVAPREVTNFCIRTPTPWLVGRDTLDAALCSEHYLDLLRNLSGKIDSMKSILYHSISNVYI